MGHGALKSTQESCRFETACLILCLAGELIEHLFDPIAFLKEVHRVLKGGEYLS